ncbi:MAG: metallophosphoesterase [Myxococcota bacterium]
MRVFLVVGLSLILDTSPAAAKVHPSWPAYMKANRYKCPGPLDQIKKPRTLILGGKRYKHSGALLTIQDEDRDQNVKIGVISAVKDVTRGTKSNIVAALDWFKQEQVEWIISNGDLALEEFDLDEVVVLLAQSQLPVLVVLGNSESKGSWLRTYRKHSRAYPNLINGTWIRQIVADDVEFWTLPGYYDKAFVHQGGGCLYTKNDIDALHQHFEPKGTGPVVLVSHGPPLGEGQQAIDRTASQKNVGDPQLTALLHDKLIPFGFFGHILEAGGRAVGGDFKSSVLPESWTTQLYLNAGSLCAEPWGLSDGTTSTGMAVLVSIKGRKASYQVKRFAPGDVMASPH